MRDKSKISGVIVLLLAVFLLAVPSWAQSQDVAQQRKQVAENSQKRQGVDPIAKASTQSQSNGDLQNDDATGKDADSNTFIDQIVIDASNCKVSDDASITIEDQFGNVGVVVNNQNADITASNGKVTVNGIPKGDDIDFFVQTGDPQPFPGPLDILASSGIVCGNKNNDGFNNKNLEHLIKKLLNQNNQGNGNNGENSVSSSDNSEDINSEDTIGDTSSNSLEDTLGDSEAGANADENGAEASTPGAVASANGDEDTSGPVGPQGDVVNDIPESGPLPNTGGISLLALAMPVLGVMLLGVALVTNWRRK